MIFTFCDSSFLFCDFIDILNSLFNPGQQVIDNILDNWLYIFVAARVKHLSVIFIFFCHLGL